MANKSLESARLNNLVPCFQPRHSLILKITKLQSICRNNAQRGLKLPVTGEPCARVTVYVCVLANLPFFFFVLILQPLSHKPHADISPGKSGCSLVISVHRMPTGDMRHAHICAQAGSLLCPLQVQRMLLPHSLQTNKTHRQKHSSAEQVLTP